MSGLDRELRVYFADYGDRLEVYDRPARKPDAVRLAYAKRMRAGAGPPRTYWAVRTTEPNRWPSPVSTKKAARESLRLIGERIVRRRELAALDERSNV